MTSMRAAGSREGRSPRARGPGAMPATRPSQGPLGHGPMVRLDPVLRHVHHDGVVAPSTIGSGLRAPVRLDLARAVGGSDPDRVLTGRRFPAMDELHPRGIRDRGAQFRRNPVPLVHLHLDALYAAIGSPGDAGDGDRAWGQAGTVTRNIDPGLR